MPDHDYVTEYADQRARTNKAGSTVQTYVSHVKQFSSWVDEHVDGDSTDVTALDIDRHLREANEELAEKTVRRRWYAIKDFYDFLLRFYNEEFDDDPRDRVDPSEYGGTEPEKRKGRPTGEEHHYLSPEEVDALTENAKRPVRDAMIIRIMFETGLRAGELSRVKLENIDREGAQTEMLVRSLKKRNKEEWRPVFLWTDEAERLLDLWLDNGYRAGISGASESPYLIPTQKRDRIREQDINETVKAAAEAAGVQEKTGTDAAGRTQYLVTSHTLRHSACRFMLKEIGLDISTVKEIMGHSKIEITELYAEPDHEDIREQARQAAGRFG